MTPDQLNALCQANGIPVANRHSATLERVKRALSNTLAMRVMGRRAVTDTLYWRGWRSFRIVRGNFFRNWRLSVVSSTFGLFAWLLPRLLPFNPPVTPAHLFVGVWDSVGTALKPPQSPTHSPHTHPTVTTPHTHSHPTVTLQSPHPQSQLVHFFVVVQSAKCIEMFGGVGFCWYHAQTHSHPNTHPALTPQSHHSRPTVTHHTHSHPTVTLQSPHPQSPPWDIFFVVVQSANA